MEGSLIILITGPKHSGKSLCAKALNETTGWEAVDLDETMEVQTGKTPRELFVLGQEIFKKAETLALSSALQFYEEKSQSFRCNQRLRQDRIRIIAAGGGLIDNNDAMALLTEPQVPPREIIVVYLDISAETAWQRISAEGELPPFLNTGNPREVHLTLHNRRAEAYKAMAGIIVSAENKSPEEIAREIAGFLQFNHEFT